MWGAVANGLMSLISNAEFSALTGVRGKLTCNGREESQTEPRQPGKGVCLFYLPLLLVLAWPSFQLAPGPFGMWVMSMQRESPSRLLLQLPRRRKKPTHMHEQTSMPTHVHAHTHAYMCALTHTCAHIHTLTCKPGPAVEMASNICSLTVFSWKELEKVCMEYFPPSQH